MVTADQQVEFLRLLKQSLDASLPQELNELDWKWNLSDKSERLKEHLSAFANTAGGGYLAFGIRDDGVVTGISSADARTISSTLSNIVRQGLEPVVSIDFFSITFRGQNILGARIHESIEKPVKKVGSSIDCSYIRAAGSTRKMSIQELRIALIGSRSLRFEELPAAVSQEVSNSLTDYFDFSEIFTRLQRTVPSGTQYIEFLHSNKLLTKSGERFLPTNLCVLCASKDLNNFPSYERYAVRVTRFSGRGRLATKGDAFFYQGSTLSLDKIVDHIIKLLPYSEIIKRATRVEVPLIPEIALREIIANAIIHRDYSKTSSFITVDVFDDRIEVTNPGSLMSDLRVDRLIDHPSVTRNEVLADFMRKLKFCEEEGTGIDKAVASMELYGLPPLKFSLTKDFFTVTLFAPKEFKDMEKEERIEAVYQHASLNFVARTKTTNSSIRQRFHFNEGQSTKVTRLLVDAIEADRIKLANSGASPRDMHYLPYWASA